MSTRKMTMVQAVRDALAVELERDPRVLVLGEDVGANGGVFRATEGLQAQFGEARVFDTPLAESGIVGTSVGLAAAGMRPVAEVQFSGFLYPAMNQIAAHLARMRNRSRGRYPMPIVIRSPSAGGIRPPEHHSESYEALFVHTPGLKVVMPATPTDAKGLLASAVRDDDPVIFLEPTALYRASREDVPEGEFTLPLGKARTVREGKDATIVAWGTMVKPALEAAREVEAQGVSVEVIDLCTLWPFDLDAVLESVARTGRLVVVHEAPRTAGLGAELAALVQERALLHLLAPIERVTGYDVPFPYPLLEKHYIPDRSRVVRALRKTLEF
jgi:pyruvate dehydrogenase E1 component beta subunit